METRKVVADAGAVADVEILPGAGIAEETTDSEAAAVAQSAEAIAQAPAPADDRLNLAEAETDAYRLSVEAAEEEAYLLSSRKGAEDAELEARAPVLLDRDHAAAVAFVSDEKQRYALNAVHYNEAARRIEATDGYTLICVPVDDQSAGADYPEIAGLPAGPMADCLIPADVLISAVKAAPKRCIKPVLNNVAVGLEIADHPRVILASTDLEQVHRNEAETASGRFPVVNDVFPEDPPVVTIRYSPDLLGRICAYAKSTGAESVTFKLYGPEKAARFDLETKSGRAVFGIIMPIVRD